jgi:hypothetical protein
MMDSESRGTITRIVRNTIGAKVAGSGSDAEKRLLEDAWPLGFDRRFGILHGLSGWGVHRRHRRDHAFRREGDDDLGPDAQLRFQRERAAVKVDQALGDWQTKAGALLG